ncbi:hypothetical protein [Thermoactinomyces sp. DSM 45892]
MGGFRMGFEMAGHEAKGSWYIR